VPVQEIDVNITDDDAPINRTLHKKKDTPVPATWSKVTGDDDDSVVDFEFKPQSPPGVSDDIDGNCIV